MGFLLMVPAFLVTQVLDAVWEAPVALWEAFVPDERSYMGTCILAFAFGPALGVLLNLTLDSDRQIRKAVFSEGDALEQMLWGSVNQHRQLMLTTTSGKVYIGWATSTPELQSRREYIRLLKLQSGYRDSATGKLTLTTQYTPILDALGDEADAFAPLVSTDFNVVVPIGEVAALSIFDPELYQAFDNGNPDLEELKELKADLKEEEAGG